MGFTLIFCHEFAGRQPLRFLEYLKEIRIAAESRLFNDFLHGHITAYQQAFCLVHPLLVQVFHKPLSCLLLKLPAEISVTAACDLGAFFQGNVTGKILTDIVKYLLYDRGILPPVRLRTGFPAARI